VTGGADMTKPPPPEAAAKQQQLTEYLQSPALHPEALQKWTNAELDLVLYRTKQLQSQLKVTYQLLRNQYMSRGLKRTKYFYMEKPRGEAEVVHPMEMLEFLQRETGSTILQMIQRRQLVMPVDTAAEMLHVSAWKQLPRAPAEQQTHYLNRVHKYCRDKLAPYLAVDCPESAARLCLRKPR